MRIVVLIKQVPLVWAMKIDPATKTLKRAGVPSEVSSFDLRALAKAIEIRDRVGGEVVVLTMGPPQASKALEECLAMGADRGVHVCDAALAGSDTLATARALAAALRREPFDLILCGRHSVDAETGQVGPEVAELLDLPQITAARTLDVDPAARRARALRETDEGHDRVECALPVLVSATEDLAPEPEATKEQREQAKSKPIETLGLADLGLAADAVGAAGSPTWVLGFEAVPSKRLGQVIAADSLEAAVDALIAALLERGLFGEWRIETSEVPPPPATPVSRSGPGDVWVHAEWLGDQLRPVTLELLGAAGRLAARLGSRVTALAIGEGAARFVDALGRAGADRVLLADGPAVATYDTDVFTAVAAEAIRERRPGIVLLASTNVGRDLAPRIAARLGLGLTGDCLDLELDDEGRLRQMKPAFGGSIVSPILSKTLPEMATVRPGMLAASGAPAQGAPEVERLPMPAVTSRVAVLDHVANATSATWLDEAEVVVGVGMGIGAPENVAAVEPLAAVLGGAICTTRDAVDHGWMERQYQVGFTGRSIAPKLYVAVGIRGAVYHMAGVRRAGLVVAINADPKAPIFKAADFGIVGDYAEVVPLLARRLEAAKAARS